MSGNPASRPETFDANRDVPLLTCLRCGAILMPPLWPEMGGRPRQYCDDACRRAGCRARKAHGSRWWTRQPWFPAWDAARRQWLADRQRVQRQREESARLRAAMPASVAAGFDQAQQDAFWRGIELDTLRMSVGKFTLRHSAMLAKTGAEVRVISRRERRIEALLLSAVKTGDETEAAALFAKARQLYASGVALDTDSETTGDLFSAWFGAA